MCANVYSQGAFSPRNHGNQVVCPPMGPYLMTMKKEKQRWGDIVLKKEPVFVYLSRSTNIYNIFLHCAFCNIVSSSYIKIWYSIVTFAVKMLAVCGSYHRSTLNNNFVHCRSIFYLLPCFHVSSSIISALLCWLLSYFPGARFKSLLKLFHLNRKGQCFPVLEHAAPPPKDSLICIRKHPLLSKGSQKEV